MYPEEYLSPTDDDGTMPENVADLSDEVVGHRIVSCDRRAARTVITLDNGTLVELEDTNDCCAFTEVENFLLHPDRVDHIITGVATTDGYTKWHIYADMGDVLELDVAWSSGNPFFYGYGFWIKVTPV